MTPSEVGNVQSWDIDIEVGCVVSCVWSDWLLMLCANERSLLHNHLRLWSCGGAGVEWCGLSLPLMEHEACNRTGLCGWHCEYESTWLLASLALYRPASYCGWVPSCLLGLVYTSQFRWVAPEGFSSSASFFLREIKKYNSTYGVHKENDNPKIKKVSKKK